MPFTTDWLTPWLPDWERLFVPRLAGRAVQGVEIGSYEGRSALWTLEHLLTHPQSMLTCIDCWQEPAVERRFDGNLVDPLTVGRAVKVRETSAIVLARWLSASPAPRFDWIYVDGSHEARDVLTDAVLAFPLLAPKGILCFDDYGWAARPGIHRPPRPAIDCFLDLWGPLIEVLHAGYQVAVVKRV